ncbi:flavohemoglobin KNAG_0A01540 [Huiozyma naganishii CBS 8797]|uniref:nitric oxide dioxygenase n=1 Tax=Huiozyma naganishii (strain ATCC MYA-139 / BCRC 22969 / CBS 8797 / KCTC 17520 / NBRC 10181 / NCYC 3082 / Yp74L-3) TaxID=1071383 RepID=J7RE58_HUIN7|nr:hypothetical protein KNAG_0A01540 [Kazachstania naganishii CBS 8797]CCK67843.1 hypothetical protein KNAG_0A01540 [Kazachstania naganishii CBS 8797]
MLSQATRDLVKATIPALEERGAEITRCFYGMMLTEHTELLNIFNKTNQKKGAQPTALATTVLAAAKNIDDLTPLLGHVRQIGFKHRALQIKPEHYPIVGEYLLKAIKKTLGDAATPEIISAWGEAYGAIADVFIQVEKEMYDAEAWPDWKPFTVVAKELVAKDIYEFTAAPVDGSGVDLSKVPIVAGQYITVNTHPTRDNNQYDALRHYSICSVNTDKGIKFACKLETSVNNPPGLVSEFLHNEVQVGDQIKLSAPAGDFALDEKLLKQNEIPLVLLSSGVGVTPLLAMLETQINANPERPIYWIQSSHSEEHQAFPKQVAALLAKAKNPKVFYTHTNVSERINPTFLKTNVPSHADVYICGSLEFMSSMIENLKTLEHKDDTIHYEPFGPKMSTVDVGLKK